MRHKYEIASQALIRTLNLPVKYVPFLVNSENGPVFLDRLFGGAPMIPRTQDGTRAIYSFEHDMYQAPHNPFQENADTKKIFSIIKVQLKIPTIK